MSSELAKGEPGPNYSDLANDWCSAKKALHAALEQKDDQRIPTGPLAKSLVESRSKLFATLAQVFERLVQQKIGDIRKTGSQFKLEVTADDIRPNVDPIVFEAFESDVFGGLSDFQFYLAKQGIIEDMSGSGPSTLSIQYTSSNGETQ
jgi:hypothetical protein